MSRAGLVGPNDYSVTEIRELQKRLKSIDPKLRTQLVRDAKEIAKPVQSSVKQSISSVVPLSGMTRGRLNWNASTDAKGRVHKPNDVKIQFRTRSTGRSNVTSLVRVRVASPAVVMADMAGKSNRFIDAGYKGTGRSREYKYKNSVRTHKINGQGRAMIRALGGKASRYVWPAAENQLSTVKSKIEAVLAKAFADINRKGL